MWDPVPLNEQQTNLVQILTMKSLQNSRWTNVEILYTFYNHSVAKIISGSEDISFPQPTFGDPLATFIEIFGYLFISKFIVLALFK